MAEDAMAKRRVEIREGKYFDRKIEQQHTLKEILDDFISYALINKHRSVERKRIIARHLLEFFGNKKLNHVTPALIERYKAKRINKDGRKPATVNREIAVLKASYNLAIRHQKTTINPMRVVRLLKEENVKLRILSDEEKKVLLDCCTEPLKRIVRFALVTGLRRSEILNLKWEDVDFARNIINIRHTKSGKDRVIHIRSFIAGIFKACYNNTDGQYVFCNEQKQPYRSINSLFQNIVKKTGLEHFSFHTLRHTAASDMLDMGVDIVTVKEILGHSDLKVTLRYAHSKEANKIQAIDKLSSRMDTTWTPDSKSSIPYIRSVKDNTFILLSDVV
jgi:integrase